MPRCIHHQIISPDMRQYNPEGSLLRRDQKKMLELLKVFADICEENNIHWWLCSGTLLGAARHKGFIPWDDDIDVAMMKKDYRKLLKVMRKWHSDKYFFQTMGTDIEYVNVFPRFCYQEKKEHILNARTRYFKCQGLSFDIFPMEKSSQFAAHMSKNFYQNMQHPTRYIKNKLLRRICIRLVQIINFGLLLPFARIVALINPKKQYHYILGAGFWRSAFYADDIFPLKKMEFEGYMFPVPGNTDAYLTKIYGDWRKLPSEEKIRRSIHCQEYYKEIFGEQ